MLRLRQLIFTQVRPALQALLQVRALSSLEAPQQFGADPLGGGGRHQPPPPPALVPSSSALSGFVERGLRTLHRVLKWVTLRGLRGPELYVREMLETALDPFVVDVIVSRWPDVLKLSWQQDIEPVLAWMASLGIRGQDADEVLSVCPQLLSKSVDDQLQPLADLVEGLGGCPRTLLLAYPPLAEVPLDHLRGTRAVLRQLGSSEEEAALLLLAYPDLYAQLARTLRELFNAYGRLGIKAFERERRRYVGMVYGRPGAGGAAAAEGGGGGQARGSGAEAEGGGEARLAVGLEQTQFVCDSDVAHRLQRVQEALSALVVVPEGDDDHRAALGELQSAIDSLGNAEGVCLRQD